LPNPISNLTATWVAGTGIELDWTAATDATNSSFYLVYVLTNVNMVAPVWSLATTIGAALINGPTGIVALPPATSYQYPWASAVVLWSTNVATPNSLAFQVVQSDAPGNTSTGVTISTMPPAQTIPTAPPHLQNLPALDAFGEFLVNNQDSYAEIADCVEIIVGTQIGQRPALPDFGIFDPTFTYPVDADGIASAIEYWEERANPTINVAYEDVIGGGQTNVTVSLSINNTNSGVGSFNG
jgi:phage baseplate assembly protein W